MNERDRVVELVRRSFGYLEEMFGYALTDVVEDPREREVTVSFTRDTGLVRVRCVAPCSVSVEVGRFAAPGAGRLVESYWQIYLVRDAHPEDEERLVALVQQNAGLGKVLPASQRGSRSRRGRRLDYLHLVQPSGQPMQKDLALSGPRSLMKL